jgi:hypothetical protein
MSAQVQHLHPQVLVRESGGDKEKRIVWQKFQCRKKVFPVPRTAKPVPAMTTGMGLFSQHGQRRSARVG